MIDKPLAFGEWTIRRARDEFEDVQWLVEESAAMAHRDWGRPGMPGLLPDDPNVCGHLWGWAVNEQFVLIAERGGKRLGFLFAYVSLHPFNPKLRTASVGLWYVAPEGSARCGYLLTKVYTEWAREHTGFFSFTLRRPSGDRMMARLGYDDVERTFTQWSTKDLPLGSDPK
jgi:hypothetical protein